MGIHATGNDETVAAGDDPRVTNAPYVDDDATVSRSELARLQRLPEVRSTHTERGARIHDAWNPTGTHANASFAAYDDDDDSDDEATVTREDLGRLRRIPAMTPRRLAPTPKRPLTMVIATVSGLVVVGCIVIAAVMWWPGA